MAAYRARVDVPAEMKARRRWVRYAASGCPLTADGRWPAPASSTDERTWSTWEAAAGSRHGVGSGYVLAPGDGVVCVDLDHCLDERGRVTGWARRILDAAPATYVEVSKSGTGLHLFGRGTVDLGRVIRREDGACVEVYGRDRYIAVTGRRFRGAPLKLGDLQALVDQLV